MSWVRQPGFSPEFRNRLDSIIQFKSLDTKTILHVVNKFLLELEVQLESKRVVLEVDEAARLWLATHGYDKKMGARPMSRFDSGADQTCSGRRIVVWQTG